MKKLSLALTAAGVALVVAAPAASAAGLVEIRHKGQFAAVPGSKISFTLDKAEGQQRYAGIRKVSTSLIPVTCSDGFTTTFGIKDTMVAIKGKTFSFEDRPTHITPDALLRVQGRVKSAGRKVVGTLAFTYTDATGAACTTGDLTWSTKGNPDA